MSVAIKSSQTRAPFLTMARVNLPSPFSLSLGPLALTLPPFLLLSLRLSSSDSSCLDHRSGSEAASSCLNRGNLANPPFSWASSLSIISPIVQWPLSIQLKSGPSWPRQEGATRLSSNFPSLINSATLPDHPSSSLPWASLSVRLSAGPDSDPYNTILICALR
jgi:hypothetical protein